MGDYVIIYIDNCYVRLSNYHKYNSVILQVLISLINEHNMDS
jgi:hypothetical protein